MRFWIFVTLWRNKMSVKINEWSRITVNGRAFCYRFCLELGVGGKFFCKTPKIDSHANVTSILLLLLYFTPTRAHNHARDFLLPTYHQTKRTVINDQKHCKPSDWLTIWPNTSRYRLHRKLHCIPLRTQSLPLCFSYQTKEP